MNHEIRQEWGGIVWRIFPTFDVAQKSADILNRYGNREFSPVLHESKNGYFVKCDKFSEVFDASGLVK